MSESTKIGIIGLGHSGEFHINGLKQAGLPMKLVSACDVNPERRLALPEGVLFFEDCRSLLSDDSLDTVVVAVPYGEHYSVASQALEAGKNVILEKPATETESELEELVQNARDSKRILFLGLHAAYGLEIEEARKHISSPFAFQSNFYDPYINEEGEITPEGISLRGSWTDSGINALSVLLSLLPAEKWNVLDTMFSNLPQYDVDEIRGTVTLGFDKIERGSYTPLSKRGFAVIDTDWTRGENHKSTRVFGSEGEWVIDHSGQRVLVKSSRENYFPLFTAPGNRMTNHYAGLLRDFHKAYLLNSSERGLVYPRTALEAYRLFFKAKSQRDLLMVSGVRVLKD